MFAISHCTLNTASVNPAEFLKYEVAGSFRLFLPCVKGLI
jgi:hypothetical protein